ncbi:MAG: hypothetical protein AAF828_08310, partial [Bacteroidota bacterium]
MHRVTLPLRFLYFFLFPLTLAAQGNRWSITGDQRGVIWRVASDTQLPHGDQLEMSGRKVSVVLDYRIDSQRIMQLQRRLIYPNMRPFIKETDPAWWATYRNYLRRNYPDDEVLPSLYLNQQEITFGPVDSVRLDGVFTVFHQPNKIGLSIQRSIYPDPDNSAVYEQLTFSNHGEKTLSMAIAPRSTHTTHRGEKGTFHTLSRSSTTTSAFSLPPGRDYQLYQSFYAGEGGAPPPPIPPGGVTSAFLKRQKIVTDLQEKLVLETPEPIYNTMFALAKVRGAESIFDSRLGLVHSPGGERYYLGFWANDQAEYINPLFPYLGYELGNAAAVNMYQIYATAQPTSLSDNIRYSFEMAGEAPVNPLDRGDAAMIAYGLSHFLLANGDEKVARELWPFLNWCLDYNHFHLNKAGVVLSESDEMEGRIETGDANLSTSSLYYAALETSIALMDALKLPQKFKNPYRQRRQALRAAIESYFGATLEGLKTYRYYEGHQTLRHWIALPLVAGIHTRKEGTIQALFDRLWTENGVHVEKNNPDSTISKVFWDRGTLYALRGAFMAGATERAHEKLLTYSTQRLLGQRVPYAVEAYPEGNMAHLSAESGLYCRVFLEGLFGIIPTGLRSFRLQPRMPADWDRMALRNIMAFGLTDGFDIEITRNAQGGLDYKVKPALITQSSH